MQYGDDFGGGAGRIESDHDRFMRELEEKKARDHAVRELSANAMMGHALVASAALTSVGTTAYVVQTFSEDAYTLQEWVFTIASLLGVFLVMHFLFSIAPRKLSVMNEQAKRTYMPLYVLGFIACVLISMFTNAFGLTFEPFKQYHLSQSIEYAAAYAEKNLTATREAFAKSNEIDGSLLELVSASRSEKSGGLHCLTGKSGFGECAAILDGLTVTTDSMQTALRRAESDAKPLMERLEDEVDTMRRTMREDGYTYGQKADLLKTHINQVETLTRQVRDTVPLSLLKSLADDWTRDYTTSGMSIEGQGKLDRMLSGKARGIKELAAEIEHERTLPAPEFAELKSPELVTKYGDKHLLLLAIAVLPDTLATLIIVLMLVTAPKPESGDSGQIGGTSHGGRGGQNERVTPLRKPSGRGGMEASSFSSVDHSNLYH